MWIKDSQRPEETFYPVAEIFTSINGEGPLAGALAFFLRFAGCNLSCSYCDTTWANDPEITVMFMRSEEIVERVRESGAGAVTITGGEPLLIDNLSKLISLLLSEQGLIVEIESNGSIDISALDRLRRTLYKGEENRLRFTLDYKLPSSKMEEYMIFSNYEMLLPCDSVKFVVSDRNDLDRAREILERFLLTEKCSVFLSPAFGTIKPREIADYMKNYKMRGPRLQLQLHKYIWNPSMRGV